MKIFPVVIFLSSLVPAFATTRVIQPRVVLIAVNSNGTFTPSEVTARVGDTAKWTGLGPYDNITRTASGAGDPCTSRDVAWKSVTDEFSGPIRFGTAGLQFTMGGNDAAEQALAVDCAACPNCVAVGQGCPTGTGEDNTDQCPVNNANTLEYCPQGNPGGGTLDSMWAVPHSTGGMWRVDWSNWETADGVFNYTDTRFDEDLDDAAFNGKTFGFGFTAGQEGTPDWICNPGTGASTVGVTCVLTEDTTDSTPGPGNCGPDVWHPLVTDEDYETQVKQAWTEVYSHVETKVKWRLAFQRVIINSGINHVSNEAKIPRSCCDGDCGANTDILGVPAGCSCAPGAPNQCDQCAAPDGVLDRMGGDDCKCNSKVYADAGYTAEAMKATYRDIEDHIDLEAGTGPKSLAYTLIQDGYPKVVSATNFEGDTLVDRQGNALGPPGSTEADDLGGLITTRQIIDECIENHGPHCMPGHLGTDEYGPDEGRPDCPWTMAVETVDPEFPVFPIPFGTDIPPGLVSGCPSVHAVRPTVEIGTLGVGQNENTNNGTITICDFESTYINFLKNQNGHTFEPYLSANWKHNQDVGSDGDMCPDRYDTVGHPEYAGFPYSNTLREINNELMRRRSMHSALLPGVVPPDPTPTSHQYVLTQAATHDYFNSAKCSLAGDGPTGRLIVTN